jgi:hypothetical protein
MYLGAYAALHLVCLGEGCLGTQAHSHIFVNNPLMLNISL